MVLYFLHALNFGEDEIGVGGHAHSAPGLVVVVVFCQHERTRLGGYLVVVGESLVDAEVLGVDIALAQLDDADNGIIDDGDELRQNALADFRHALYLERTDALGLDEQLVGHRLRPQQTP